ncbi:MAG: GSCFA domain-containing protein [Paludibacteraceae bacterium]|nr:GSCFA domain-containing protein [Paludibacteraceae bacterium]
MKLYTSVDIAPSEKKIAYNDKILLLGSCFADNIGAKFGEHYFQTTVNPFGTLYNPASIARVLSGVVKREMALDMVQHNGLWHSMMHHGSFSHPDKDVLLARCEESQTLLRTALQEASTIIVTFGTSWVYKMDGMVVANCHKMPAERFNRYCMSASEIIDSWLPLLNRIPNKHWIFTVSPIRHIKDGLHANHLSKANLLHAIDVLIANARDFNPTSTYSYFPSYEIMLDELRDYRFYAEDMVHPSQVAEDYIWQRFVDTYMTADTKNEMRTLHQLWLDRHHTLLHPTSEEAMRFRQHIEKRTMALKEIYPWIQ